jgi:DNA-binding NarL/FixJ family response regulator
MQIILADDSANVRSALRLVLEQSGHRLVGEARDAGNLLAQAARACPDVVILDAELEGIQPHSRPALRSLAELVETLRLLCPQTRIIALSSRPRSDAEMEKIHADAQACKSDPPDALLEILAGFPGGAMLEGRKDENHTRDGGR